MTKTQDETKRAAEDDLETIDFAETNDNNNIEIRNADDTENAEESEDLQESEKSPRSDEVSESEKSPRSDEVNESENISEKSPRMAGSTEKDKSGNLKQLINELEGLTSNNDHSKREDTATNGQETEKREASGDKAEPNQTLSADQIQQEIEKLLQQQIQTLDFKCKIN